MAETPTDQESLQLDEIIERLDRIAGPLNPYWLDYLREMVRDMPRRAQSFKTTRQPARQSELARKLEQIRRNPARLIKDLAGPGVTRARAWERIGASATYRTLLFHYAQIVWGERGQRHLGPEGDVLDHLRESPKRVEDIIAAARFAFNEREQLRPRGSGGLRHSRDSALQLACEHILDIYVTITGKAPSFSVLTKEKNPEVQIKGPAVDFLETCLSIMGLATSRPTLRRCIEEHRANMRRTGDPRVASKPLHVSEQ